MEAYKTEKELDTPEIVAIELDIMVQIHQFCEEHKLTYFLWGGTLLGAIRHNGFIPWDDDIDIAMPRKDYEYFLQHFQLENYGVFACNTNKRYPHTYAKAFRRDTVKIEWMWQPPKYEIGIDVDIFPLDDFALEKCSEREIKKRRRMLVLWGWSISKYKKGFSPKTVVANTLRFFLHGRANKLARKINKRAVAQNHLRRQILLYADSNIKAPMYFDKALFAERELHQFEQYKFYISKEYDALLTQCYGDYMTPPPKEKQVTHHSFAAYRKG